MKNHTDDILKELWFAKDSNAKQQGSLELYFKKVLAMQAKGSAQVLVTTRTKASNASAKATRRKAFAVAM